MTEPVTSPTVAVRPHRRRARVLVAALLAVIAAALAPGAAYASGSQDNNAVAVNTKDGSSLFKFAFSVARVMGDTVTDSNAAVAYASCTDCQTTAIAIQVVIVVGDPANFAPTNTALAINESCDLCDTLASAYQFVVQASGPVHFNADGNQQLQAIRKQIAALRDTTLSAAEIQARLDDLTSQLQEVLRTDLVAAGPPQNAATTSSTDPTQQGSSPSSTSTTNGDSRGFSTSTTASTTPSSTTSTSTTSTSTTSSSTTSTSTTSTSAPSTTSTTAGATP